MIKKLSAQTLLLAIFILPISGFAMPCAFVGTSESHLPEKKQSQNIQLLEALSPALEALKKHPGNVDPYLVNEAVRVITEVFENAIPTSKGIVAATPDGNALARYLLMVHLNQARPEFEVVKSAVEVLLPSKEFESTISRLRKNQKRLKGRNSELLGEAIDLLNSVKLKNEPQLPRALTKKLSSLLKDIENHANQSRSVSNLLREAYGILTRVSTSKSKVSYSRLVEMPIEKAILYFRETGSYAGAAPSGKESGKLKAAFETAIKDVKDDWGDGVLEGEVRLTSKPRVSEVAPLFIDGVIDGKPFGWVVTVEASGKEAGSDVTIRSKRFIDKNMQVERVELPDFQAEVS